MNNLVVGKWARTYTNALFRYYPETANTFLGRVDCIDDQAGTVRLRNDGESIVVPEEYVVGPVHVVALIACSQSKRDVAQAIPAGELYTGQLLRASVAYAERLADEYLILSAKYGLLAPDACILPYDQALNTMTRIERRRWATRVFLQLGDRVRRGQMPHPNETETLFIFHFDVSGVRYCWHQPEDLVDWPVCPDLDSITEYEPRVREYVTPPTPLLELYAITVAEYLVMHGIDRRALPAFGPRTLRDALRTTWWSSRACRRVRRLRHRLQDARLTVHIARDNLRRLWADAATGELPASAPDIDLDELPF